MSSIYIQEPQTSGKVLLITTVGDIDVELWCKECPKTCWNFIQLCMEGYYDNTVFHRVVPGFIVQGGDPCGDGSGGDSVYGAPFKDEFHQRLRYTRRGLVGMANSGKNDNASQFFFTLAETPELQNVNTLFGKVTGNTIFNMMKLGEGLVDHNERPLYLHKIVRCEILSNPFTDIVPRILKPSSPKVDKSAKKSLKEGKREKNFKLLSFGEEAEDDEGETTEFLQKIAGKAKSLHDVVNDPKLSKETLKKIVADEEEEEEAKNVVQTEEATTEDIIKKIHQKFKGKSLKNEEKVKANDESDSESYDNVLRMQDDEKQKQNKHKKEQIRANIQTLKKSYQEKKREMDELLNGDKDKNSKSSKANNISGDNALIRQYINTRDTYQKLKKTVPKSGAEREAFTLKLLTKFRSKLEDLNAKEPTEPTPRTNAMEDVDKELDTDVWLTHTLHFDNGATPVLAKDAMNKGEDYYDITDPRHPINIRKRSANTRLDKRKYRK